MSLVKVIASGLVYIASREAPSCLPLRLASPRFAFAFALPRPNKGGRSFENPAYLSFSLSSEYPRTLSPFSSCCCPVLVCTVAARTLVDAIGGRDVKPE